MNQRTREKQEIAAKVGVPFESLSESYLRAETILGALATYDFKIQVQTGSGSSLTVNPSTQQLLKQNDLFIVTHIGLMLKKIITATASDALQASARLYNYPNPFVFDGAAEVIGLNAVFNGFLSFTVDRKVYVPALETRNFLRIPDAQEGATQAAIAGPVEYKTPRDGFPNSLYGYYPTDIFQFDGQQTLDFSLKLGGPANCVEALETNYVVLMLKGYLAQDQAKKQNSRAV